MGPGWWKREVRRGSGGRVVWSQPEREENGWGIKNPLSWSFSLHGFIPITTQTCCYFSHLQTKQNKAKSYPWPPFPCQLLFHFSAPLCSECTWKSSLLTVSNFPPPIFPKPTPMRLLSTETSLVKVTSDLHFPTYNGQFPGLILPGLLALDAADNFLLLDTASALGS